MHMLTIAFGGMGMAWKFVFKTAEAADAAWNAATNSVGHTPAMGVPTVFQITDDFGQRGKFSANNVTGVLLEDLDESKLAHIEHSLHEMKTRAQIQQRMQNDPALRFAAANGPGGPAMINPMGGRGGLM